METGSPENKTNRWLGVSKNRDGNRYTSVNKIAQSIIQRSLSLQTKDMDTVVTWLRRDEPFERVQGPNLGRNTGID